MDVVLKPTIDERVKALKIETAFMDEAHRFEEAPTYDELLDVAAALRDHLPAVLDELERLQFETGINDHNWRNAFAERDRIREENDKLRAFLQSVTDETSKAVEKASLSGASYCVPEWFSRVAEVLGDE